ncbi:MAG TPA: hypothetical protein VE487_01075 [Ilumatobacter sp.]|nr:hypothetical protein [Ilumatobacter sp.]
MTDRLDRPNLDTDRADADHADTDHADTDHADTEHLDTHQDEITEAPPGERSPERVELDEDTTAVPTPLPPARGPSWGERAWTRIVRRPTEWAQRPWPADRVVRYAVTVFSLVITTVIMFNVVHLSPFPGKDLVFDDTTPTGGDFGAHVWGPAYLRDHLLPSFRLNGWTMDWYAGMPAYRFYMVLPALAIVLINVVLPYGVAMKLISILGLITLPASCWAFGRLARFRWPMPELFAFAGLAFALDESFSIYGGNLKSTMAGEFSFSIALSLAMLGLGLLAAGLRTGKYRVWASVLIAAACVSHGIVLLFVAGAALVFCVVWLDRTRLIYAATVGITSVLLTFWWTGPFLLNHALMTDMKYGREPHGGSFDSWSDMYFPLTAPLDTLITTLAIIGFIACVVRRHLNGVALGITGILLVAAVYFAQDSLPVIGLLWNPRLLPFLYLVRYLLMMVGAVELLGLAWNLIRDRSARGLPNAWEGATFAGVSALAVLIVLGWMYQVLPGGKLEAQGADGKAVYTWGPFTATDTNSKAIANGWSRYNFMGYEGRGAYYTEYYDVVQTMKRIGDDPSLGCGRASWENSSENGNYGTTMALMLLPFWTDGCIGSMEGLFFEASGTTPYHFLTTAAMSKQSSNPVRALRYVDNDAEVGVRHLRDLGVKYVMVRTTEAKAEAASSPDLSFIATSYPWDIYQVQSADLVMPLDVQPVVVNGRSGDQRERNLELGTSWFQNPDDWAAMPADGGPDDWQRIDVVVDESRRQLNDEGEKTRVDIVVPEQPIDRVALPPAEVSNVEINEQSLSFDVDRTGVPVLVRVSYFPNWDAKGAEGPYRIGPNMMVVVPTSNHVEMTFGRSATDYITILLSLVGIGLCFLWRRQGDVVHASEEPAAWWWRGDVPGERRSLAGAHARYEDGAEVPALDDDLDHGSLDDRDLDDRDLDDRDLDYRGHNVFDEDIDNDVDGELDDEVAARDGTAGELPFQRPLPSGDTSEPTDSDR